MENFRSGEYNAIVTSQVLDEGEDFPDASVGFILSGTGSTREYVHRLGRLLRKVEGKQARLIDIVSKETAEVTISRRRRQKRTNDPVLKEMRSDKCFWFEYLYNEIKKREQRQ